jgi:hypothetical protein
VLNRDLSAKAGQIAMYTRKAITLHLNIPPDTVVALSPAAFAKLGLETHAADAASGTVRALRPTTGWRWGREVRVLCQPQSGDPATSIMELWTFRVSKHALRRYIHELGALYAAQTGAEFTLDAMTLGPDGHARGGKPLVRAEFSPAPSGTPRS